MKKVLFFHLKINQIFMSVKKTEVTSHRFILFGDNPTLDCASSPVSFCLQGRNKIVKIFYEKYDRYVK